MKLAFFKCFCYFWRKKICFFKLNFSWISGSHSLMEEEEGCIFSIAPGWKPLLLLKIKVKQNPGCPNEEHNAIFEHIPKNIWVNRRNKKRSAYINDWKNIVANCVESAQFLEAFIMKGFCHLDSLTVDLAVLLRLRRLLLE